MKTKANRILDELENMFPEAKCELDHRNVFELLCAAKDLDERFDGQVPESFDDLTSLPGVGRKTANVIQAEGFKIPALAVDTHVERVSKRLGLVDPDESTEGTESTLKRKIPKYRWIRAHHLFIFFGRYRCKAQRPLCGGCPFESFCVYLKGKTK